MAACCPSKLSAASRGFWQQCTCAVLGGLLCSSCCIVQLLLNSFSVGCAGFAVLTPYRSALLGLVTTKGINLSPPLKPRRALLRQSRFWATFFSNGCCSAGQRSSP